MKILCFRLEPLICAVILMLLTLTAWMTVHRKDGYNTVSRSYQELYAFTDERRVEAIAIDAPGSLTVTVAEVGSADDSSYDSTEDAFVETLELAEGQSNQAVGLPSGETQPLFRMMSGANIDRPVVGSPVLAIGHAQYEIRDFATSPDDLPPDDVASARQIATAQFGVSDSASDFENLRRLAHGLHEALVPSRGWPKPYMRRLNGFQQYQEALKGSSGIYCGNHAEIFAFFANAIGIPTRIVDVIGQFDDVALGAHAFNESFDSGTGSWIYIDLQLSIFGIRDGASRYLNVADLLHRMAMSGTRDLVVEELRPDGIRAMSYANKAEDIAMFLHPQVTLMYLWASADRFHPLERLKRLLIAPQPGYSLRDVGFGAEIRLLATALLGALLTLWCVLRLRHYLRLCSCPPPEDTAPNA